MKQIVVLFCLIFPMIGNAQLLGPEPFNSDILVHGSSAANTVWFAPSSNPAISFVASGGCTDGRIGYSGSWNGFWGNFVRLPQVNASGMDSLKLSFDISHSYTASTTNDWIRFYIWADGAYKKIVSTVKINGVNVLYDFGVNGKGFKFTELRNCAATEVVFDLSTIVDKSSILIYLEPNCAYNNSSVYSVYFDNITVENAGTTPFSVSCRTDSSMCIDNPAWALGGCTPAGGIYSGNGVSGGVFNPSTAGVGTHSIKYKVTDGINTDSCYFNIEVLAKPTISISVSPNDTLCEGVLLTLTASGGDSYLWSNGVTNGIPFTPSTQGYIVQVLDANGCQSDSTVSIMVNTLPTVTLNLPYDSVCGYSMPVFPTYPLSGGLPSGGTYNGSDVQGTDLVGDIVGGEHFSIVQYVFTDNHGCSNTAMDSVYLYNCETGLSDAVESSVFVYPNPASDALYINHNGKISSIEILSIEGKLIHVLPVQNNQNITSIDITSLNNGAYLIRWKNESTSGIIPFVKE